MGRANRLMNDSPLQLHMGMTCQYCSSQGLTLLQEWACRSQESEVVQGALKKWGRKRPIPQEPVPE